MKEWGNIVELSGMDYNRETIPSSLENTIEECKQRRNRTPSWESTSSFQTIPLVSLLREGLSIYPSIITRQRFFPNRFSISLNLFSLTLNVVIGKVSRVYKLPYETIATGKAIITAVYRQLVKRLELLSCSRSPRISRLTRNIIISGILANFSDIQTVLLACISTLLPLIIALGIAFGVRYANFARCEGDTAYPYGVCMRERRAVVLSNARNQRISFPNMCIICAFQACVAKVSKRPGQRGWLTLVQERLHSR